MNCEQAYILCSDSEAQCGPIDRNSFEAGWQAAMAELRPHLDELAKAAGVAPTGDRQARIFGIGIGAEQAQM